jgi:hypothetical protein
MAEGKKSRVVGWIITLAVLGGVNLASYLFGWSFWIY